MFVQTHITFRSHRKVRNLAKALKTSRNEARGCLIALWSHAWDHTHEGRFEGWSNDDIADAADWEGALDSDGFVSALQRCRLLDDSNGVLVIHDFMLNSGRKLYEDKKIANAERQRNKREKEKLKSQNGANVTRESRLEEKIIKENIKGSDQSDPREDGWTDDSLTLLEDSDQEQVGTDQRPINTIIKDGLTRGISIGIDKLEAMEPISQSEVEHAITATKRAKRPLTSYGFYATAIRKYREAPKCSRENFKKETQADTCIGSSARSTGALALRESYEIEPGLLSREQNQERLRALMGSIG